MREKKPAIVLTQSVRQVVHSMGMFGESFGSFKIGKNVKDVVTKFVTIKYAQS